jgi:hypothetical protein
MADIEKDFKKAMSKKTGKDAEVAEAKRQQRIADAKDDLAKRTGADRTATRKAEYDAEKNLSRTRKFGADKPATTPAAEPVKAPAATTATAAEAPKAKPANFREAFKEARARLGAGKTFTFGGKSYTTNIAGEGRKASAAPAKKDTTDKKPAPVGKFALNPSLQAGLATMIQRNGGNKPAATNKPAPAKERTPFIRFGRDAANDPARKAKLADMKRAAEAPGASGFAKSRYKTALETDMYAKGGKVKEKGFNMTDKKKKSMPPQPTAAERARSKAQLDSLKKAKVSPEEAKVIQSANRSEGPGYKKGGKMASCGMKKGGKATKFGAAMKKKSADTKGRAMMKYAKGGSIDGCATKGKTKGRMV